MGLSRDLAVIEPGVLANLPALVELLGAKSVNAQVDAWNRVVPGVPLGFNRPAHVLHAISEALGKKPQLPFLGLLSEAAETGRNRGPAAAELKGLNQCARELQNRGVKLGGLRKKLWNPEEWQEATAELLVAGLLAREATNISLDNPTLGGTNETYDVFAEIGPFGRVHTEIKVCSEMLEHIRPGEKPLLMDFQDFLRIELLPLRKSVWVTIHRLPYDESEVIEATLKIVEGLMDADKLRGSPDRDFWTDAEASPGSGGVWVSDGKRERKILDRSIWDLMRKACRQVPAHVPPDDLRVISIVSQYNYEVMFLRPLLFGQEGLWTNESTRDSSAHIDGVFYVSRAGNRASELNLFATFSVDAKTLANRSINDTRRATRLFHLANQLTNEWED